MFIVSHETKVRYLAIFFMIAFCLSYQNVKTQVAVNSPTLGCFEKNSFSFDPADGPKDFNFLKNVIADKRILILAEADEGDGTSIQVISQMMQFAIDSLGFKVVAFDNGNVDVNYFQNKICEADSAKNPYAYLGFSFLNSYGFDIIPFLQTRLKEKKIELFGLDFRVRLDSAVNKLIEETSDFVQFADTIIDKTFISLSNNLQFFGNRAFLDDKYAKLLLEKIDLLISSVDNSKEQNMYRAQKIIRQWMNMKYLVTWLNRRFNFANEDDDLKVTTSYLAARDSVMAENLIWMLNFLYPKEKIIVNVTAYHASRFSYKIEEFAECCKPMNVKTFGELMAGSAFKNQIYSIVFLSSGGSRGVEQTQIRKLPAPKLNSIEYLFSKTKFDYAFLDLNTSKSQCYWLNQAFFMAPFFDRYFQGNWADIFNGVVYIRNMKPNDFFR
jgi:erythromycin esterase-like protein